MNRTIIVLILLWLGWHSAFPVDLVRSDLGRYIDNGRLILHGTWDVLYKNHYSYTYPQYPFINYSWLFGVFCFCLWHYFGFTGLSLVYLLLELFAFYLFFRWARRYASFGAVCALALLSFPFITFRIEVRPEGISYLFCGLFWWLMDSYQHKRLKSGYLMTGLCLLQIIWVNTHVFFMMGPLLAVMLLRQARVFFLLLGACLINPFGIHVFLLPFDTWHKASSFSIIEGLPVIYVLKEGLLPYRPVLLMFLAALAMLGAASFYLVRREGLKKYLLTGSLTLILSLASLKVMRMIGLFGYFWMPLSAYVYSRLTQGVTAQSRKNLEMALVAAGIIISATCNFDWQQKHALGIVPGANDAAGFFKREKISGPIFNNYGIGGYLIFHLSPSQKVFIDNRGLAAFPDDFVVNTYVQMQRDDGLWHQLDQKYHFNAIFISPEHSPGAVNFLKNRLADHDWALVFLNRETRIFLKRNAQNKEIIRRNEIYVPAAGAEVYYRDGIAYAKQNDFTQAMSDFNKAIAIDPNYADAYNNRGFILGIQGDLIHAMSDFNQAVEINPDYADAYNNRAFTYFQLKEYAKAWADVHKTEELGAVVNPGFINLLKKSSGNGE